MRPKRPTRPPKPPPPLPAVVKPEDLDAINTPEVDKLPAYISVGKFQWKPPLPGPKGDPGAPGSPGAPGQPGEVVRPITPPIETAEIGNGQVTPEKLSFSVPTRPLVPPVATGEIGAGAVGSSQLAVDSVSTEKLQDSAVTSPKLSYKVISVTIPAGAIGRTEPPLGDPELVDGVILGYSIPTNQDQIIKQLVLLPNGAVSITLDKSASSDNTFVNSYKLLIISYELNS